MTLRSYLWTNGKTDGGPVSEAHWQTVAKVLSGATDLTRAILSGVRNEAWPVTSPGNNALDVPAFSAVCAGAVVDSDAVEQVTGITTPAVGDTGKVLVLRRDASAGTVRLAVVASADGTSSIPSITNTDPDATYDWAICSFVHATTGAISSITDMRSLAAQSGFQRVAGDSTERTSNSTTNVDLATLDGFDIPAGQGIIVRGVCRKADTVGQTASLGLKINGSQRIANFAFTTTTNRAESGMFEIYIGPRVSNYNFANVRMRAYSAPSGSGVPTTDTEKTGGQAAGSVTSITITGQTANSGITVAVDEISVYALGGE